MELETTESGWACSKHHWGTTMEYYAGIDVSLESASLCVVDATGRIVREAKVASEPETLIDWFGGLGFAVTRIGLEAGPLSQWLYAGMRDAGLAVELLETRHVRDAFKAMPVKTDRKDARGIAQPMRLSWFRPVHCKSLPAPGSASAADGTQAAADEEPRRRDEPARGAARLWTEGRPDDTAKFPWPDPRTGRRPYHAVKSGRCSLPATRFSSNGRSW